MSLRLLVPPENNFTIISKPTHLHDTVCINIEGEK